MEDNSGPGRDGEVGFFGCRVVVWPFCLVRRCDTLARHASARRGARAPSCPGVGAAVVSPIRGDEISYIRVTLFKLLNGIFRVKTFYMKVTLKYKINLFFKFIIIKI